MFLVHLQQIVVRTENNGKCTRFFAVLRCERMHPCCEWLGVWDNGSRGRHCERLMPKERVLSCVEHTLQTRAQHRGLRPQKSIGRKLAHEKDSTSIGLLKVFRRSGIRHVFEIKTRALVGDFEIQVSVLISYSTTDSFSVIQSISMDDSVVYSLRHSNQDIAVAIIVEGVIVSNFIN